jgi:hypothetical protein
MDHEQVDDGLYPRLNPCRTLRRMTGDVVEDQSEVGKAGRV